VPGLRRGEVAMLAGVSGEYYTRLELGNLGGVSDTVLDAVANALQLDEAERDHLFDLARIAGRPTRRSPKQSMPKTVRPWSNLLDAMTGAPALVRNARLDILAVNALGYALYSEVVVNPVRPAA
jgi:transcriptional regulator with XRE-family HTH domain